MVQAFVGICLVVIDAVMLQFYFYASEDVMFKLVLLYNTGA